MTYINNVCMDYIERAAGSIKRYVSDCDWEAFEAANYYRKRYISAFDSIHYALALANYINGEQFQTGINEGFACLKANGGTDELIASLTQCLEAGAAAIETEICLLDDNVESHSYQDDDADELWDCAESIGYNIEQVLSDAEDEILYQVNTAELSDEVKLQVNEMFENLLFRNLETLERPDAETLIEEEAS